MRFSRFLCWCDFVGSFERQRATPAGKATAEDRREWGSRGSWSVARGKETRRMQTKCA
ncbi:hypothetical protein [Halalkalibacterium halodurans]|uniref:hypothetical protein n=1 Tax=Halalkalibacterium halodurans TaxID=86665 RepID=UPI002AA9D786|nr:hypothetical protein [Halalkalibacterium halodurans]MDY7223583.1 hypothetical protein [Halalkalibacterium halodurans]MDY7242804.1 hypothetical protein [Halalkalibacterium halodurans]